MIVQYDTLVGLMMDLSVIIILVSSGVYGWCRSCVVSISYLIVHVIAFIASISGTLYLVDKIQRNLLTDVNVISYVPELIRPVISPHIDALIVAVVFISVGLLLYLMLKSLLISIVNVYYLEEDRKQKLMSYEIVDRVLSSVTTIVTTVTYLIVPIIIIGFPSFQLVSSSSLSSTIIEIVSRFSNDVAVFYAYSEVVDDIIDLYDQRSCEVPQAEGVLCVKAVASQIARGEGQWSDYISLMNHEAVYLQLFEARPVTEVMMLQHVNYISDAIQTEHVSKKVINLYYKELLETKTYDKLLKNQDVLKTSLSVLIQSEWLNTENRNKLKEYLQ